MQNYTKFLSDLKTLISFKSVKATSESDAPFGVENKKALHAFLDIAKSMGFETINYDNYGGEIVFGQGQEIGIIGHLDVVPAGEGWNTDPYTLTEKDGILYGRGVLDDKTGCLMALYALKELKDSNQQVNKKFRLIVGCNEESGWKDIEYISTKTSLPLYGFSPDGNFPLSYAEKGVSKITFTLNAMKNFSDIKGGTAVNAVCAHASVKANDCAINQDLIKKHDLIVKNDNVIESFGKSAHGSHPELGINAIKKLFEYFADIGEMDRETVDALFNDKFNLSNLKTEQGIVTFSPNVISEKGNKIYLTVDCRIPAPLSFNDVKKIIDKFGLNYVCDNAHPPMMVEKEGWFVQTLITAYNNVTGENLKPVSLGGSTFARAFKYGVAFGPEMAGSDGCCHEANEHVSVKDMLLSYDIYKKAIFDLAKHTF